MVGSNADLILHASPIEAEFDEFGFDFTPNLEISILPKETDCSATGKPQTEGSIG